MDIWVFVSVVIGLACAGVATTVLMRRNAVGQPPEASTPDTSIALLFRDDQLIDADNAIWPLLPDSEGKPTWQDVAQALQKTVPAFPKTAVAPVGEAGESGVTVQVTQVEDVTRVTLIPKDAQPKNWFKTRQAEVALAHISPALDLAPNAIWFGDPDGTVQWSNATFKALEQDYAGSKPLAAHITDLIQPPTARGTKRISLKSKHTRDDRWFDVSIHKTAEGDLHFASAVDAVVKAEEAQRNFVQTLSKTFANLTTGLAIFNRDRRLALFNPALIDLSGLSAEFLSGRPNLFEFFDKLREQQIMPEPKNYDDWRERMAKLVAAASDDRFRETWTLSDGQTYDVTGRPYPDGAIAFLFNDITAEVSLTRGFRTELETMQSLIDTLDDAVAVFNQQGILTVCNAAYKEAWKVDPDTSITDANILDATQDWKAAFHPNPIWPEIRDFVTRTTERASWDTDLRSRDGRDVTCRIDPMCYGATLIRFSIGHKRQAQNDEKDRLEIVSA
ncbi:PAS-domain containing protein [Marivita sp. S0852]|uniref:PAS-domain containing protein n=1 Tax=Marivita sp. S0852 TaxID=3373893 RepID=UPI0039825354